LGRVCARRSRGCSPVSCRVAACRKRCGNAMAARFARGRSSSSPRLVGSQPTRSPPFSLRPAARTWTSGGSRRVICSRRRSSPGPSDMELGFLLTSLIVVVSPGTGVLYTVATGLSAGRRASVVAAFGCTLGILPHMIAAIVGLAAVLYASAIAFETIKYLGVAYLIYMGWRTLKD